MRSLLAAALSLAVVSATVSTARANGRFPAATQVVTGLDGSSAIALRTTFGVLVSHDEGGSFRWVCEAVAGYGGEQDPAIAFLAGDILAVASAEGLTVSRDGGCSFTPTAIGGAPAVDVAVVRGNPPHAFALRVVLSSGENDVRVFATVDDGMTWSQRGAVLDGDFVPQTIDVAPSAENRVYVSGATTTSPPRGVLLRSDDGGDSWTRTELDLQGDLSLFVAAVDPQIPDRLYARTYGTSDDRLLSSSDGGATFSTWVSVKGSMAAFALSPDGARIAVGGYAAGILIGDAMAGGAIQVSTLHAAGLAWSSTGLYVADGIESDGVVLAVSRDEGSSFTPVLESLSDVGGPLEECAAGGPYAKTCAALWPGIAAALHADAGTSADASPKVDETPARGGSSCAISSRPIAGAPSAGVSLLVAALLRRRRRHGMLG